MTAGVWVVRIPAPIRIRSVNQRIQGRGDSAYRRLWRETAYAELVDAHVPQGLDRVRIDIQIRFRKPARRDTSNYHSIAKPIVDACGPERRTRLPRGGGVAVARGHGVIADDTPRFLCCTDDPHITFGDPVGDDPRWPFGLVMLTITDLSTVTA